MIVWIALIALSIKVLNITKSPTISTCIFTGLYFVYSVIYVRSLMDFVSLIFVLIVNFVITYFWHMFLNNYEDSLAWWIILAAGIVFVILLNILMNNVMGALLTPSQQIG